MRVPSWWQLALLALAAYRTARLIGWDVLTRPLRTRLTHRSEVEGTVYIDKHGTPGGGYRPLVDEWIHCPFCCGAWVSVAWWASWLAWPTVTLEVAIPFVVSAIVGLVAKNLDE